LVRNIAAGARQRVAVGVRAERAVGASCGGLLRRGALQEAADEQPHRERTAQEKRGFAASETFNLPHHVAGLRGLQVVGDALDALGDTIENGGSDRAFFVVAQLRARIAQSFRDAPHLPRKAIFARVKLGACLLACGISNVRDGFFCLVEHPFLFGTRAGAVLFRSAGLGRKVIARFRRCSHELLRSKDAFALDMPEATRTPS
jgi:hypothetical protein